MPSSARRLLALLPQGLGGRITPAVRDPWSQTCASIAGVMPAVHRRIVLRGKQAGRDTPTLPTDIARFG